MLDWISEIDKKDYINDPKIVNFYNMIKKVRAAGSMTAIAEKNAHKIGEMRNLIHPKKYFEHNSDIDEATCKETVRELKKLLNLRFKK